jgi:hypothetical protein
LNIWGIFPPPCQNAAGVCNQIALLILHYISSRLVNLLKVIDTPIQVSDILIHLLVSSSSILGFRYFFLFPEKRTRFTSYIV